MAEARSIAKLSSDATSSGGVSLSYGDDGVHFTVRVNIPTPRVLRRVFFHRLRSFGNWLARSLYPIGPLVATALVAIGVSWILLAPPDSWVRTGWLAELVWNIGLYFPWIGSCPLMLRLVILAAWTSFAIAFIVALVQRVLIRCLLRYKGFLYNARKPTLAMKVWFAAMRLLVRGTPKLFDFQNVLPALPVPDVKDTCRRYLESVQPHQAPDQFAKTQAMAKEFLATVATKLQRYLVLKSWYANNYVTDWWEKYVYLHGRDPIVINSNYYVLDGKLCPTTVQEARLALILYNMVSYSEQLASEELKPTVMAGVVPLCMDQFRRLFHTTRLPGRDYDTIKHWDDPARSRHVAILCNGSFYTMDLYAKDGTRVSRTKMQQQLAAIKADALSRTPDPAEANIAALTGENRTRWAEARESHFAEGLNRRSLHAIESAFLFVHMDVETEDVESWEGRAKALMHGNGATRWFDKSITLVVFKNGRSGMNAEHSFADAPVVAHLYELSMIIGEKYGDWYDADGNMRAETSGGAGGCSRGDHSIKPWQRLNWALSRPCEQSITNALATVHGLIADLDLRLVNFDKYGKGFMKACRVSPDAYIQMAMQLAYYRDIGQFHATYEASMTRLFKHGRTETVRPVTPASVDFVMKMIDDKVSPGDKLKALQAAAVFHQLRYQDAMAGKGVDRHLFALYIVSKGMEVESPFLKAALGEPWRLSTSQQPQNQTGLWNPKDPVDAGRVSPGGGFGPVTDDGYGVSYMVASDDELFFHVSSKRSSSVTDSTRFVKNLFAAFDDMKAVLSQAHTKKQD